MTEVVVQQQNNTVEIQDGPTIVLAGAGAQGPAHETVVESPTFAADLEIDWDFVDEVRVTLSADFAPEFVCSIDGWRFILTLEQDGTGGHDVTLPADVRFSTDLPDYSVSLTPGMADKLGFIYHATDDRFDFVAVIKGIS